ncbi:PepSY domain-containing protein [Paenalkalicoccus suaedae]|uniref:PepSY domain-containing protein n=1 Tax=Paenalkalicoccus suaedae TaxID=2592382 RepID=A0A859FB00_9BACI|nr:PepSY domain-containing protein [Paenalkalicoccus suaedae]QKS70120.1 PepSY domain-containing protein [Paenalkalicoccus suaedae]
MKKRIMQWVVPLALIFATAAVMYLLLSPDETLAESDVRDIIEARYVGTIEEIRQDENMFIVTLVAPMGEYVVQVDRAGGDILSFEQTSETSGVAWEDTEPEEPERLTLDEVREIASEEISGEEDIVLVDLADQDSGFAYYQVEATTAEHHIRLEIDAVSGDILTVSQERIPEDPEEEEPIEPINEAQAREIALAEFAGVVDDIDLEEKDGRLVYEIEIENDDTGVDADIIIDAYSGEVLSVKLD